MALAQLTDVEPVGRRSVVDDVISTLLNLILDGSVAAGEALAEDEVKNLLGVSRVTARTAIADLTARGIVTKDANRPARVTILGPADVLDLYWARMPIELEAVRFITKRGGRLHPGVKESVAALAASEGQPGHVTIPLNLDFHRLLVGSTNNRWLLDAYSAIEGGIQLALVQSDRHPTCRQTAQEHARLLRELKAGNWERARDAMIAHLRESESGIAASVEG